MKDTQTNGGALIIKTNRQLRKLSLLYIFIQFCTLCARGNHLTLVFMGLKLFFLGGGVDSIHLFVTNENTRKSIFLHGKI